MIRLAEVETWDATITASNGQANSIQVSSSLGGGLGIFGKPCRGKTTAACQVAESFLADFNNGVVTMVTNLDNRPIGLAGETEPGIAETTARRWGNRLVLVSTSDAELASRAIKAHGKALPRTRRRPRLLICEEAWMLAAEHAKTWERITGRWWNDGHNQGWGWDHDVHLVLTTHRVEDLDVPGAYPQGLNMVELCRDAADAETCSVLFR